MATRKKAVNAKSNKKVVKGSGGLTSPSKKWMNWKLVTALVLLVAIAGGLWVWKSSAASSVFSRDPKTGMTGGSIPRQRSDGKWQRNINGLGGGASTVETTTLTLGRPTRLKTIYATVVANNTGYYNLSLMQQHYIVGGGGSKSTARTIASKPGVYLKAGQRTQLVGSFRPDSSSHIMRVLVKNTSSSNKSNSVGVLSIFGTN